MELSLNLIWFSLVLAAAFRFARWGVGQTNGRRRVVALATICVLALLFPIISVTDDLHSDAALVEDSAAVRRASTNLIAHVHAPIAGVVADLVHSTAYALERLQLSFFDRAALDAPLQLRAGVRIATRVRPPPAPLA